MPTLLSGSNVNPETRWLYYRFEIETLKITMKRPSKAIPLYIVWLFPPPGVAVRRTKVILTVGPPLCISNMCPLESIQRSMEADKCPIKECFFTNDTQRYKQTADVLLILKMWQSSLKDYLPKPAHQVPLKPLNLLWKQHFMFNRPPKKCYFRRDVTFALNE